MARGQKKLQKVLKSNSVNSTKSTYLSKKLGNLPIKNICNESFFNKINNDDNNKIIVLDCEKNLSCKTAQKYNIPKENIICPNFDPVVVNRIKKNNLCVPYRGYFHELIQSNDCPGEHTTNGLYYDGTGTWEGNMSNTYSTKNDIKMFLDKKLLTKTGLLGITVSLRKVKKYDDHIKSICRQTIKMAKQNGYNLKQTEKPIFWGYRNGLQIGLKNSTSLAFVMFKGKL